MVRDEADALAPHEMARVGEQDLDPEADAVLGLEGTRCDAKHRDDHGRKSHVPAAYANTILHAHLMKLAGVMIHRVDESETVRVRSLSSNFQLPTPILFR